MKIDPRRGPRGSWRSGRVDEGVHIWHRDGGSWRRVAVGSGLAIGRAKDGRVVTGAGRTAASHLASIVPFEEHGVPRAALLTAPHAGLLLNGYPPLGVTVLGERDAITIPGAGFPGVGTTLFFATRGAAERTSIVPEGAAVPCGRCAQVLRQGDAAVYCPVCGVPYHDGVLAPRANGEAERRLDCWSYDPLCAACRQPRESMSWSPSDEDADDADDADDTNADLSGSACRR